MELDALVDGLGGQVAGVAQGLLALLDQVILLVELGEFGGGLAEGVLDLGDLFYFLSMIGFMLYANIMVIESKKAS